MKQRALIPLLLLFAVACATTPMGRAYQVALTIEQVNKQTATALDFDMLDADTGEYIQTGTRVATADLKRAVADIRSGKPRTVMDRALAAIEAVLMDLQRKLAMKGLK